MGATDEVRRPRQTLEQARRRLRRLTAAATLSAGLGAVVIGAGVASELPATSAKHATATRSTTTTGSGGSDDSSSDDSGSTSTTTTTTPTVAPSASGSSAATTSGAS